MSETVIGFLVSPIVIIAVFVFLYLVPLVLVIKSKRAVSDKAFGFVIVLFFSWLGYFAVSLALSSNQRPKSEQR